VEPRLYHSHTLYGCSIWLQVCMVLVHLI